MNKSFSHKIDKSFWFIVTILPILIYLAINLKNPSAAGFFTFMESFSPFSFIANIFDSVSTSAFGAEFAISAYLAYCVGVEIFHVLFDVIVFIPRLAHKWIAKAVQDE